jgi:uncharacterized protein (TIGR00255 family)
VRSLNHKFCEVKVRAPRELSTLEPLILKAVKDRLVRGAVDVTLKRQATAGSQSVPQVDLALAREYRAVFARVAQELALPDSTTARDILVQPGVLKLEERGVALEAATEATERALGEAVGALVQMREVEGHAMRTDLESRLALIQTLTQEVKTLSPRALDEYRTRLSERVAELARGVPVEPQRLAQEVALYAERTDVAEEMTRLASHLEQFRALLAQAEPSGRKMDFLVQEMHREVNTTGSKSQHPEISKRVVALKAELERIREQVQNVE